MLARFALLTRVLRAEGPTAFLRRVADHLRYGSRPFSRLTVSAGSRAPDALRAPVLHLLAAPASPWFGGVEVQLSQRRSAAARNGAFALLVGTQAPFRLEVWQGRRRFAGSFAAPSLATAVERVAAFLGSDVVHVENLSGFDPAALLPVPRAERPLVLSLFDFGAFCSNSHLLERPQLAFCGFSTDFARCGRCLGEPPTQPAARRAAAAQLLAAAAAVTYPSEYLRRENTRLFPGLDPARQHVVPPGFQAPLPPAPARARSRPLHVAYLGSVQPHKGSRVFRQLLEQLTTDDRAQLRFSAYGGGLPEELAALRRLGVRTTGYFRIGSLPRRLRRDRVDLALLLSVFPETHCLVLDDCRAAGVPVVAFDFAALGERIRSHGGGRLVDFGAGAAGVLEVLRELGAPDAQWPEPARPEPPATLSLAEVYTHSRSRTPSALA